MLNFCGGKIQESEKQDIVTNIEFEAIVTSIKKYFFHQRMVDFVNKLELSDRKYQTIINLRDTNYKDKFLFPIKDFLLFGTDCQSMYIIPTKLLKDNINGACIKIFQLAYIRDTTHP